MLDLECRMVDLFGWSLNEIDETDINSLMPFLFYYPHWKGANKERGQGRRIFADQAGWL